MNNTNNALWGTPAGTIGGSTGNHPAYTGYHLLAWLITAPEADYQAYERSTKTIRAHRRPNNQYTQEADE